MTPEGGAALLNLAKEITLTGALVIALWLLVTERIVPGGRVTRLEARLEESQKRERETQALLVQAISHGDKAVDVTRQVIGGS